jgi:hypothetical protein
MSLLGILGWAVIAATLAWGLTLRHASETIAALRVEADREIRHWSALAARERTRAMQLERELGRWAEGCRQGREDVVSIVPMLLAAQGHPACLCQSGTDIAQ